MSNPTQSEADIGILLGFGLESSEVANFLCVSEEDVVRLSRDKDFIREVEIQELRIRLWNFKEPEDLEDLEEIKEKLG